MLSLAYNSYLLIHYTKGTITQYALFDNCTKIQFSRHYEHFHPSLAVLCSIKFRPHQQLINYILRPLGLLKKNSYVVM